MCATWRSGPLAAPGDPNGCHRPHRPIHPLAPTPGPAQPLSRRRPSRYARRACAGCWIERNVEPTGSGGAAEALTAARAAARSTPGNRPACPPGGERAPGSPCRRKRRPPDTGSPVLYGRHGSLSRHKSSRAPCRTPAPRARPAAANCALLAWSPGRPGTAPAPGSPAPGSRSARCRSAERACRSRGTESFGQRHRRQISQPRSHARYRRSEEVRSFPVHQ